MKLGKSAISLASDLQEVQNVVDVAFGSMAGEVEEFSKSALKQFGLSELAAKRMASTFMAMGKGLGIDGTTGKEMALTLTGLAGDIASFFNVEETVAQTALESIYTGETETLKKFGIVMTEANLQAFALAQGITKSYGAMSQAEKVALRYQYVLQQTALAQGDFVRTGGSWANQVRLLKEQWSQLLGIMGSGLIQVLTPIVSALNQMLSALISVGNAIAKLFGGKSITSLSTSVSNVSSGMGDAASGARDLGSGLDDSNASAQKLAKTIAGFDELNVLASQTSGGGSGGGGAGGGGGGSNTIVDSKAEEKEEEGMSKRLKDFLDDCKKIIEKWKDTIPKLEIHFDKKQALDDLESIAKNMLNVIAGWGSFIITIGIKVANDLDIGKLANDFLSLVESATHLASAMTDVLVPAFEAFYDYAISPLVQAIGDVASAMMQWASGELDEWSKWFEDNKDTIIEFATNLGKIVNPLTQIVGQLLRVAWEALAKALSLIGDALRGIATVIINLDSTQLKVILDTLLAIAGIKLGTEVIHMFSLMSQDADGFLGKLFYLEGYLTGDGKITDFFVGFGNSWSKANEATKTGIANIVASFKALPGKLVAIGGTVKTFVTSTVPTWFSGLPAVFSNLGASITSGFSGVIAYFSENGILGGLLNGLKVILGGIGTAFKGLWAIIAANPLTAIVAAIAAVTAALVYLWNTNENFRQWIEDFYNNCIKPVVDGVVEALEGLWNDHIKPLWESDLKPCLDKIWEIIKTLWDKIAKLIGGIMVVVSPVIAAVIAAVGQVLQSIITVVGGITDALNGILTFISGVFTGNWKKAWEGIQLIFKGLVSALVGIFRAPINGIIGLVNGMLSGIASGVNLAIRALNRLNITIPSWIPGIGGEHFGFNIGQISAPQIPYLADGGVITSPTMAMVGEYAGAKQNPEIVTPQSLLEETINTSNKSMIDAMYQMCKQMITAIEGIDMEVSIGDDTIAKSAKRGSDKYKRVTGKPMFA